MVGVHIPEGIIRRMYLMITIRSRLMTGTVDFTFMNMQGGQTVDYLDDLRLYNWSDCSHFFTDNDYTLFR